MATIGAHISNIRGLIRQYGRNQDAYTDQFLYSLLNAARGRVLEQNANKLNHNSEWDWRQFFIKLVPDKSHLIGCITVGCDIMRSEYKLPRPLLVNMKSMIAITTLSYGTIIFGTEQDYQNNKFNDIKSGKTFASIINGYLVIWNNKKIKGLLVSGIWEDMLDWAKIPHCDEDGNYTADACFNPLSDELLVSLTLQDTCYDFVIQKLGIPLRINADVTNDSNLEIKQ